MGLFKQKTPEEIEIESQKRLEKLREKRLLAESKTKFLAEEMEERRKLDAADKIKSDARKQRMDSMLNRFKDVVG